MRPIDKALAVQGVYPHSKLLLLAMSAFADGEGRVHATSEDLAVVTCLKVRTVNKNIRHLQDAGLLAARGDHGWYQVFPPEGSS